MPYAHKNISSLTSQAFPMYTCTSYFVCIIFASKAPVPSEAVIDSYVAQGFICTVTTECLNWTPARKCQESILKLFPRFLSIFRQASRDSGSIKSQ